MSKRGKNLNKSRVSEKKRRQNSPLIRLWEAVNRAWEQGDHAECLDSLIKMERLAPENPKIHLELGRIRGMMLDYAAAESSFDRCMELAAPGERPRLLVEAGRIAREFYEPELADNYFSRALETDNPAPDVLVEFAMFSERGSPQVARELVDRALSTDPDHLAAKRMRGHLLQKSGEFEAAEEILRPLAARPSPPQIRAQAGYDLGALLDRTGRYDEAMEAFVLAKSMMYEEGVRLRDQRDGSIRRVFDLRERLTPEVIERWHEQGEKLHPQRRLTLLGGHPRSGTTLLEQVLDAHDDICSAEETMIFRDQFIRPATRAAGPEVPIFDIWDPVTTGQMHEMREAYFDLMAKSVGGSLAGRMLVDKNPSLTLSPAVLSRCFPEMKFLIALRDPRDVVMSCFMQPMFPLQQVNATWLQLGTAAEEYANLMGSWLEVSPMLPNPQLTVRYEDMVEDLETVARKALEFLGVEWDERVLDFHKHAQEKRVRSPTYAEVTRKIFTSSRGRWRNYEKFLDPHMHQLEPFLEAFGYE